MIDTYSVKYLRPKYLQLSFVATEDATIWIEIDGVVMDRAQTGTGVTQTVDLRVSDASAPVTIALHEVDDKPEPIYAPRDYWSSPELRWQAKAGSTKYLLYHGDNVIKQIAPITDMTFYEITLRTQLTAGWHNFRVEAVDTYGRETTRANWTFQVFLMPTEIGGITAAQDETTLTITVDH